MTPFEAVRENLTTRQAAEFYGIKVGRNGMACCPFHNDKQPSMKIDRRFHCFGCGADGDAVDFVSELFGLSLKDAAVKICSDFGLTYDLRRYTPPVRAKPIKSDEQIFKEVTDRCFSILCDYLHLLKQWKTEYAPEDADEDWHPLFCEALKEIDHVEYLLDTLMYANLSDRASFITDYGKKVNEIERRINGIRSGNYKKDQGGR